METDRPCARKGRTLVKELQKQPLARRGG
jgi:hypothetical protein